ncbi:MAG TPA: protein-disulfide reductase DsbD domain-containing protein [Terriglobia bacterium]|nr:protein-disulfide reductase DsbD domain-containing protein [Terriglobia bacterium]
MFSFFTAIVPKPLKFVLAVAVGCLLCWLVSSAPRGFAQGPPRVVEAHVALASDGVHPGSSQKAAIVSSVSPGYHINAHKPSFDYLIPTEVKFDNNHAVSIEKTRYPAGKPQKLSFSDDPLSVYQGRFLIGLDLKVPAGITPGVYTIKGELHYQACNDRACLAPSRVPLTLTVKVVPATRPLKPENSAIFHELRTIQAD